MVPHYPVENNTAVFRCEVKFGGANKEQILEDERPHLRLFFADFPTQELLTVGENASEGNIFFKVSDIK